MSDDARTTTEVTVAAAPDAVWRALREPAEVARWFGWRYDGLAAEIDQIFFSEAEASDAERRLETGDGTFDVEPAPGANERTVIRVTRRPPAGGAEWTAMDEAIEQGWITFVEQLRFALERHPGEDRQTIYLAGHPGSVEARPPAAALGLAEVGGQAPGNRYEAVLPWGDELAGEVRYVAEHQLGLSVDGWGDGLLVLTGGRTEHTAPVRVEAILTTYGLDDDAVASLEERWTEWWRASYAELPSETSG